MMSFKCTPRFYMRGVPLSGFTDYIRNTLTWIMKARVIHIPTNISNQIQQNVTGALARWGRQLHAQTRLMTQ